MGVWDVLAKPLVEIVDKMVPDRAAKDAAKAALEKQRAELDAALHQKQVEQVAQAASYEAAWNLANAQAASSSWKDEYWTIIFSVPLIGAFIPGMQNFIASGFAAIDGMPTWYKAFVGTAVSAAFGYQKLNQVWTWWQKP